MRTLSIVISHLPAHQLSPNARVHWSARAKWVKSQREEAGWIAKSEWIAKAPMQKARISYTFHVTNNRRRDIDNLVSACKSFQDGLVDAGVLARDDSTCLAAGFSEILVDGTEQTIIKVEEV